MASCNGSISKSQTCFTLEARRRPHRFYATIRYVLVYQRAACPDEPSSVLDDSIHSRPGYLQRARCSRADAGLLASSSHGSRSASSFVTPSVFPLRYILRSRATYSGDCCRTRPTRREMMNPHPSVFCFVGYRTSSGPRVLVKTLPAGRSSSRWSRAIFRKITGRGGLRDSSTSRYSA